MLNARSVARQFDFYVPDGWHHQEPRRRCLGLWACLGVTLSLCLGCGEATSGDRGLVQFSPMDATIIGQDAGQNSDEYDMTQSVSDLGASGTVEATFRVINPGVGQGFSGVTISGPMDEAVTDASGQATLLIPQGPYRVSMNVTGARTHEVWGESGDTPFQQITYLSTDMITGFVFGSLGLTDDPEKGILVVGLDTPTLAPAIGAEARIDVGSDQPFVFSGIQPTVGQIIPDGGQGFVTFPNVTPGPVRIETNDPNGRCLVFPAETDLAEVEVVAGQVTVIAFTCRAEDG